MNPRRQSDDHLHHQHGVSKRASRSRRSIPARAKTSRRRWPGRTFRRARRNWRLICDDPDAPQGTVGPLGALQDSGRHDQPAGRSAAGEDVEDAGRRRAGRQLLAASDNLGYRGPMPPPGHGTHHYHFKLYALDRPVPCRRASTRKTLLAEIDRGHVCWPEGELMERIRGEPCPTSAGIAARIPTIFASLARMPCRPCKRRPRNSPGS